MPKQYKRRKGCRDAIYVIGPSIAYLPLQDGSFATIDSWRARELSYYNWHNRYGYALRHHGKNHLPLHHAVLRVFSGQVDHKNRLPLDNREANLRMATHTQNMWNSGVPAHNSSGVTGVWWGANVRKWRAAIKCNHVWIGLGCYQNFSDAVVARREAEKKYFGEFCPK